MFREILTSAHSTKFCEPWQPWHANSYHFYFMLFYQSVRSVKPISTSRYNSKSKKLYIYIKPLRTIKNYIKKIESHRQIFYAFLICKKCCKCCNGHGLKCFRKPKIESFNHCHRKRHGCPKCWLLPEKRKKSPVNAESSDETSPRKTNGHTNSSLILGIASSEVMTKKGQSYSVHQRKGILFLDSGCTLINDSPDCLRHDRKLNGPNHVACPRFETERYRLNAVLKAK